MAPLAEFERAIPVSDRPQTYALVRATTGMDVYYVRRCAMSVKYSDT